VILRPDRERRPPTGKAPRARSETGGNKQIPRGGTLYSLVPKETLINCLSGMKYEAHGAEGPRHIQKYVEVTSTAPP
jgi:hypothetical protein